MALTTTIEGVRIPDSKLAARSPNWFATRCLAAVSPLQPGLLLRRAGGQAPRVHLRSGTALRRRDVPRHGVGEEAHSSANERFEVDGANVARDFLRGHGISQQDIDLVWTAIALHTTPGIPQHMHPVVALVTAGVEMDVLGLTYPEYSEAERTQVVHAHPRTEHFKEDIIQAFYDGIKHKPETTFGNVKAM
jgi:hypothetical protein